MTTVYNAVNDFLTTSNTNAGPWTYGYSEAGGADYRMVRFDSTTDRPPSGVPGIVWSKAGYNTAGTPSVWRNLDTFPRYGVAPGQMSLHPGPRPNGDFTILRFTAPSAGRYKVVGQFFAGDSGAMSARILRNEQFANPVVSFQVTTDASAFDLPMLDLDGGERLDFVVGNNGNFGAGNTPLALTIEAEAAGPSARVYNASDDFQGTGNSGAWRYGYSVAYGPAYAFVAFDTTADNQTLVSPGISWSKRGYNIAGTPTLWLNQAAGTRFGVPAGGLSLHPGPRAKGDCAVLRFVVPLTGRYRVNGSFYAGDTGRMDGAIVLDANTSTPLRYFAECLDNSTFDLGIMALSAGQTLDFVVGNNGNFGSGNTPVSVRIAQETGTWNPADMNDFVDRLGRMPPVVAGPATEVGAPTVRDVDAAGVTYRVTEQRLRVVKEVLEHAYLSDIAAMGVWPGQVIQSNGMLRSNINAIGPFARMPGRVEIVTPLVSSTPGLQYRDVPVPDAAAVNAARQDILNSIQPTDSAGILTGRFERANTLREVGLKLDLTVTGSAFGVEASAKLNASYKRSLVVGVVRQVFYSVTFTPAAAGAAGFWDHTRTSAAELGRYMTAGNPPLYVNSVQFGRLICVTAEGAFSSDEIEVALKAHYESAVKVGGSFGGRNKEVVEGLRVSIYTIGVPGHLGFETIRDPVTELDRVYNAGRVFDGQNPGAPISFTCLHLADGSSAHVQVAAEYVQALSALGADISGQPPFEVFDGPSGGLRDTRINVNPADKVTIRADGMIWSGVFASGLNGPEGWPGNRADAAAPLPEGTAYCLVHKFSRDSNWQETKRFWDGSSRNGGRLLLNTNDNNPYNGDPSQRWRVRVEVVRGSAGAVGVFI